MATRRKKVACESTGTQAPTKVEAVEAVKAVETVEAVKAEEPVAEVAEACCAPVKAEVVPEVFVQYLGKDVSVAETTEAVKRVWTEEMGHKVEEITSLSLYFRTEINRAYFVINGEASGSVAI